MTDLLSAKRVRLVLVITLGAALTLGSFWVLEMMRKGADDSMPALPRNEPDYYVEKFNFVRMSQSGQARYNISGKRLTHNPADDSFEIQLPVINSLGSDRPPMTVRAQRALVNDDSSKVHLYDDVHIDRPATPAAEHFHVKSDYLLVLPDDDVMQTDKPVDITLGTSRLTGTGMLANNATRELRVSGNVHATYQSPLPAASR
jgi:lipopolysaccharide export system protein LptC